MLKKIVLAMLVACTAGSSFVFAGTPVINRRERRQATRIHRGVKSGQLTKEEAAKLKQEVRDVNCEKRDFRRENGGKPLTAEQRKLLNRDLNKTSRDIYREKHDGDVAASAANQH